MQSVVRAASLGQLARASAIVVPSAVTSVKETPLPSAGLPVVQASGMNLFKVPVSQNINNRQIRYVIVKFLLR